MTAPASPAAAPGEGLPLAQEITEALAAEQAALVWTLRSQARVGSYQHEVSSGPWHILLAAEGELKRRLAAQKDPRP